MFGLGCSCLLVLSCIALSGGLVNGDIRRDVAPTTATAKGTFLVIAPSVTSSNTAVNGLNDYGIPYETLIVPTSGTALPTLNTSTIAGNYGAIVITADVSLTTDQWNSLYAYQTGFGVRMVRLNASPSSATGTKLLTGCCADGVEQTLIVNDTARFPTAGLIKGAALSTLGLWHNNAALVDSKTVPFLQFGTASLSVGGVFNTFTGGRQQMVFFISFAPQWSVTSTILTHAWIHWSTRGIYAGHRRLILNTQVDDVFLTSLIYSTGEPFRIRPADFAAHISWMSTLNAKLPKGSNYTIELAHNGNGNIIASTTINKTACGPGPISYASQPSTDLEYVKPLGTGANLWPANTSPSTYPYSKACTLLDSLLGFFSSAGNRDAFSHISHTFTHLSLNNATYSDTVREISWNAAWLAQTGFSAAKRFSTHGLVPPAITGLHNGDALRAWTNYGITSVVGDNTRPVLLNTENEHWPLLTKSSDGFVGMTVLPRWAENIYYNCDTPSCIEDEYADIYDTSNAFDEILENEQEVNANHLLGLRHDAFMFHQANLRQTDAPVSTLNGVQGRYSLLQMWVETVLAEITRLVTWPILSLPHEASAQSFKARMARDKCAYQLSYKLDQAAQTITAVTVTAASNVCEVAIPVTVPGKVVDAKGFAVEQVGSDPLTVWVRLGGAPVELVLGVPVAW